jgi:alkylation response protein AidB-like acyl-CoA dehydrogenase
MHRSDSNPQLLDDLLGTASQIGRSVLAADCDEVDAGGIWPERGLRALADAGLMGLHVPEHLGGKGLGLVALAKITEELGRHCSSTAMCFGMHSVATKVLAARATPHQEENYLRPIAEGRHITSLALSEPGTGIHFFLPRMQFQEDGDEVVLNGEKSFVTSGSHADSYVMSAVPPGEELDPGTFTCFVVDGKSDGLEWKDLWRGMGMRGNSSRGVRLNGVRVPRTNTLGSEGDELWYVFEIVAPYFIVAMCGVYLGIAQGAYDAAVAHLKERHHTHTGETLSEVPVLAQQVAEMWMELERTRHLMRHAAKLADRGDPAAQLALFAAKADVASMVTSVTQTAVVLSGGRGYSEHSCVSRLMRDAQASHIMSPTTDLLKSWLGRSLLDLPML